MQIGGWSVPLRSPVPDRCSDSLVYPVIARWKASVGAPMLVLPANKSPELKKACFCLTASVSLTRILTSPSDFVCILKLS